MKIILLTCMLVSVLISGCNSKSKTEKESDAALQIMLKPKNSAIYSYDQTVQKLQYEECLAKQKNNTAKGECHEPDFLKK